MTPALPALALAFVFALVFAPPPAAAQEAPGGEAAGGEANGTEQQREEAAGTGQQQGEAAGTGQQQGEAAGTEQQRGADTGTETEAAPGTVPALKPSPLPQPMPGAPSPASPGGAPLPGAPPPPPALPGAAPPAAPASRPSPSPQPLPRAPAPAKTAFPPGGHRGAVTALGLDWEGRAVSAGEDGFLEIWDVREERGEERFQVSPYALSALALRPGAPEAAVIESNGLGILRLSVWDYARKERLFTINLDDPATCLAYSGSGNFIILGGGGVGDGKAVTFYRSATGEVLPSPEGLTGRVTFAATGKSERSMVCYSPAGALSYWNLASGEELERLEAPRNITSPALIGSNRFLTGFDREGLLVLDAVSGEVLRRDKSVRGEALFTGYPAALEFVSLAGAGGRGAGGKKELIHFAFTEKGLLEVKNRKALDADFPAITAGVLTADSALTGSASGRVSRFSPKGDYREFEVKPRLSVLGLAAAGGRLAFLAGDGSLGVLPLPAGALGGLSDAALIGRSPTGRSLTEGSLTEGSLTEGSLTEGSLTEGALTEGALTEGDLTEGALTEGDLTEGAVITLSPPGPYTNIAPGPSVPVESDSEGDGGGGGAARFILWQAAGRRDYPLIVSLSPREDAPGATLKTDFPARLPLMAVSAAGGRLLFLDSAGKVSLFDCRAGPEAGGWGGAGAGGKGSLSLVPSGSVNAAGALDAVFIDSDRLLLSGSAAGGGRGRGRGSFMMIHAKTGETVPFSPAAEAGLKVCLGGEGRLYGAAARQTRGAGVTTAIVALDASRPGASRVLLEYPGEDTVLALAECRSSLAVVSADRGAFLIDGEGAGGERPLARSAGLPLAAVDGGSSFILADTEGNITWHDPVSGAIQAELRLYETEWLLRRGGETLRGPVQRRGW